MTFEVPRHDFSGVPLVALVEKLERASTDQLFRRRSKHRRHPFVGEDGPAIEIDDPDAFVGGLDHASKPGIRWTGGDACFVKRGRRRSVRPVHVN